MASPTTARSALDCPRRRAEVNVVEPHWTKVPFTPPGHVNENLSGVTPAWREAVSPKERVLHVAKNL